MLLSLLLYLAIVPGWLDAQLGVLGALKQLNFCLCL
jgi:hypothetical protein